MSVIFYRRTGLLGWGVSFFVFAYTSTFLWRSISVRRMSMKIWPPLRGTERLYEGETALRTKPQGATGFVWSSVRMPSFSTQVVGECPWRSDVVGVFVHRTGPAKVHEDLTPPSWNRFHEGEVALRTAPSHGGLVLLVDGNDNFAHIHINICNMSYINV